MCVCWSFLYTLRPLKSYLVFLFPFSLSLFVFLSLSTGSLLLCCPGVWVPGILMAGFYSPNNCSPNPNPSPSHDPSFKPKHNWNPNQNVKGLIFWGIYQMSPNPSPIVNKIESRLLMWTSSLSLSLSVTWVWSARICGLTCSLFTNLLK